MELRHHSPSPVRIPTKVSHHEKYALLARGDKWKNSRRILNEEGLKEDVSHKEGKWKKDAEKETDVLHKNNTWKVVKNLQERMLWDVTSGFP